MIHKRRLDGIFIRKAEALKAIVTFREFCGGVNDLAGLVAPVLIDEVAGSGLVKIFTKIKEASSIAHFNQKTLLE